MENVHCAESVEFSFIYKETKYNKSELAKMKTQNIKKLHFRSTSGYSSAQVLDFIVCLSKCDVRHCWIEPLTAAEGLVEFIFYPQ